MKKIGLVRALALTKKADKISISERALLRQKRLKELISYVKEHSPYFAELAQNAVLAEVYLSEKLPETNPVSGKYKHIITKNS